MHAINFSYSYYISKIFIDIFNFLCLVNFFLSKSWKWMALLQGRWYIWYTQFSIHYLKSRSDLRVFSHRTSFPNSQIYGRFIKSTSFSERRYVGVFTLLRVGVLELDADFRNWKKDIWGTDVHDVEIRYKLRIGRGLKDGCRSESYIFIVQR